MDAGCRQLGDCTKNAADQDILDPACLPEPDLAFGMPDAGLGMPDGCRIMSADIDYLYVVLT